jgi:GMP synthase (glutamine-hydrolysing)
LQDRIKSVNPKVIILSGGPNSVHVEGSPRVPDDFFRYCQEQNIPVLGICYGMQLIVQVRGRRFYYCDHQQQCLHMSMRVIAWGTAGHLLRHAAHCAGVRQTQLVI